MTGSAVLAFWPRHNDCFLVFAYHISYLSERKSRDRFVSILMFKMVLILPSSVQCGKILYKIMFTYVRSSSVRGSLNAVVRHWARRKESPSTDNFRTATPQHHISAANKLGSAGYHFGRYYSLRMDDDIKIKRILYYRPEWYLCFFLFFCVFESFGGFHATQGRTYIPNATNRLKLATLRLRCK